MDILSQAGNEISSGTDLDTLTTPGKYYSQNASISATLINTPFTTAGFSMFVFQLSRATSNRVQLIFRTTSTATVIYYRVTSGTWGNWYVVSGTAIDTNSLNITSDDEKFVDV